MTYAHSKTNQAIDFNSLAGLTGTAAGSSIAAQKIAGYLWGIGYGDRGYQQTSPALTAVSAGITSAGGTGSGWSNLQSVLSSLCSWTGTSTTLLPASSLFGKSIVTTAYPASDTPSIVDLLTALDSNRLNTLSGNMTLTSNVITSTRSTAWGLAQSAGTITCTMAVTFSSEDAARLFFNTGGQLRIALAHPNTATALDTDWNTALNNFVMSFSANATARITGSNGVGTSIGYYQLTTANQTILSASSILTSPYASSSFSISAKTTSVVGFNGGNGTMVTFTISLTSTDSNSSLYDSVASGTNAIMSHYRATSVLAVLPAAPTCAVVTGF